MGENIFGGVCMSKEITVEGYDVIELAPKTRAKDTCITRIVLTAPYSEKELATLLPFWKKQVKLTLEIDENGQRDMFEESDDFDE